MSRSCSGDLSVGGASFVTSAPPLGDSVELMFTIPTYAGPIIASAVIVSLFPVLAATLDGMRSTDPGLVELFQVNRATRLQRWWKLELPWAIPSIVTGLRIAAGLAVIGTIVGEFVGAFAGEDAPVGILITSALRENRTDMVFAAVFVASAVGFVLFGVVSLLGWVLLRRWHASAR